MPDDHTLGQVMRYESHLARLFHRDGKGVFTERTPPRGKPAMGPKQRELSAKIFSIARCGADWLIAMIFHPALAPRRRDWDNAALIRPRGTSKERL